MRLYKTTQSDAGPELVRIKWDGTQADAASTRKEWNSRLKIPRDQISTEEVDVPTTKKELLEWLNGANTR